MDNLPKEENGGESPTDKSGEIFSDSQVSGYQETTVPEIENPPSSPVVEEEIPLNQSPQDTLEAPPSDFPPSPPPPYEENKLKKYLVVFFSFIIVTLVVAGGFFLFRRFFLGGKGKSPEAITLTYWGLWEEKEIIQPVIDDYKRKFPNITINYLKQDPKQYRERLQAAIGRGEGPDIFRFHNTWVPMLINELASMPQNIYAENEFNKTFYPVASSDLKVNNNFYGIPLMIDGLLLFYNEDILKSANVSVPATWVDVQNLVPKITVKENEKIITSAIALGTADNIEHFSDILGLMMLQNGVQMNKSLTSCLDASTTTCAIEALSFYHKFAESPNNSWDDTLENSITAFASGHVAMIFAPSWQIFSIKEMNPNLNFKVASVPQLPCDRQPCSALNWATYWVEGVSNKSKNQKAAWEFLKYLSQKETMLKLYSEQIKYRKLFGEPYSRQDLGQTLADNPYLAALISSAPTMKSFYFTSRTYDGETGINTSLIKYLKDGINSISKGVSPETAVEALNNGIKQVFSRFNLATGAP